MTSQTFYRAAADISAKDAVTQLTERYPKAELESFTAVTADASQARVARVKPGDKVFAAKLSGDFEEATDKLPETTSDENPEAESPKPEVSDEVKDEAKAEGETPEHEQKEKEEGDTDDKAGEEGADDAPPLEGEKKLKPEEEMVHLLKQLLDAVVGGGGLGHGGDDMLDAGPEADVLPDIGAPTKPSTPPLPARGPGPPAPPHAGPPAGPPAGPAGMKPPAPVKPVPPPGAAFAHTEEVTVVRKDSGELGTRALIAEAGSVFPNHRIAKIQRKGSADIDGKTYDLAKSDISVLTLVKR